MTINKFLFSSNIDTWETPPEIFEKYNEIYKFDLDVCATPENAKCDNYFTPEMDGLKQQWSGTCWMNPPYGRTIGKWVKKAHEAAMSGSCTVVALLPARTDTKWFHSWIYEQPNVSISFLRGRVKFVGGKHAAPFPSMIVEFKAIEKP